MSDIVKVLIHTDSKVHVIHADEDYMYEIDINGQKAQISFQTVSRSDILNALNSNDIKTKIKN